MRSASMDGWILLSVGLPRPGVRVEYRYGEAGEENLSANWPVGWISYGGNWFKGDSKETCSSILPPLAWRPLKTPPIREVGKTQVNDPITMTCCPSHYVLSFEVDGRKTEWVDMPTAKILREALKGLYEMVINEGLAPKSVSYVRDAKLALDSFSDL